MIILTGRNLSERHREFNLKLDTIADKITSFDDIDYVEERTDINKLFKIGLASRFKNLEYIVETLKSGSSLYITRALKCTWIYDDGHSDIINPSYLEQNIFPYMSQRMKKKMLTIISLYIRHEDRVISFYTYCMKSQLKDLAVKFLIYAPETFKINLITNNDRFYYFNDDRYLKDFISDSLSLAISYVEMHSPEDRICVMHTLRFLYFKYTEAYLDMLEKYDRNYVNCPNSAQRLGIKISKDILEKHKRRIWKNAVLFLNKLNKNMLVKFLTIENVKNLAPMLLPSTPSDFWFIDFYNSYRFIFDLIPSTELFAYLKAIFTLKYNNELFELDYNFYSLKYYEILSVEEQESWALLQIERQEELLGSGNDYIWYKFVRFDKALEEMKNYVYVTVNSDKRSNIVNNLIYAAKSQVQLTKLLNYYYERHVNESFEHKTTFIDLVMSVHDVYAFTDECWTSLHKLLYSFEEYGQPNTCPKNLKLRQYARTSALYHILNGKEFSEYLQAFFKGDRCYDHYYEHVKTLSVEQCNMFMKYWLDMRADELRILLEKPRDDKIKEDIGDQVYLVWSIIWCYNRDEKECPEIVMNYMKSNLDLYVDHPAIRPKFQMMTEEDFVRLLKNDIQLCIDSTAKVKCNAHRWSFRLNRFLRKLKVYFSNDVSKCYLEYFLETLELLRNIGVSERIYRNIKMAVVGIFKLGSKELQLSLVEKYAPINKKIDHPNIDRYLLQVQKAICRLIYYSSPPLELSNIRKYVAGDYLHYCLPLFSNYLANLPLLRAVEFIYEIIDSPVSVQKHGLRLAFKCFSVQDLVPLAVNTWKKTKNVSLRLLLYKTLFTRMVNENGDFQKTLYDVLKVYTLDLNDRDDTNVFDLLVSDDVPEVFRGDYIETAWHIVSKFSNKSINVVLKTRMMYHMKENIYLLKREFLRENIIDEHVGIFINKNSLKSNCGSNKIGDLMKAKWDLTATFIISGNITLDILKQNWKLLKSILIKCMQMWSYQYKNIYTFREFCSEFLNTIHAESSTDSGRYTNVVPIYRYMFSLLRNSLPKGELYLFTWNWKLYIESRTVIYNHSVTHKECMEYTYPCAFEIADDFSRKVAKIVEKLVDNEEFHYSFYPEMANTVISVCGTMGKIMDISPKGFDILFSGHLTQFKMPETRTLAVMVMPKNPPEKWEKRHANVIQMMKQYGDDEIKSYIVHKFPYLGCDVYKIA